MMRFAFPRARLCVWIGGGCALGLAPLGFGSIVAVSQFVGDRTDTFNQYNSVAAVLSHPVFNGLGTLDMVSAGGAIKREFSSALNGVQVVPLSGMMVGQLGIADWRFLGPVYQFGGFWANNSGVDDATVTFFDSGNNLLGTVIAHDPSAAHQWNWNGWASDVAIARVHVVGNGLINGFLWYDNMQVVTVPGGSTMGLVVVALGWAGGRRRRVV